MSLDNSVLGKKVVYKDEYDPTLLFAIPRLDKRKELGLEECGKVPFFGVDIWNAYELSLLNPFGKPIVAIGEFYIPATSVNIIESKSLKLYLNSFNNTQFESMHVVKDVIARDLSLLAKGMVNVKLSPLYSGHEFGKLSGINIDGLDISCAVYDTADRGLLLHEDMNIEEEINSNLLKSNCLVTGQPDWGSVSIKYKGKKLKHESVLRYLVSFRNHNEFHEQCVERIFIDILNTINPIYLSVYARYTRRGGLDICPYRTTDKDFNIPENDRLSRQ